MKRRSFIKHAAHSLAIPSFLGALGNESFAQTLDTLLRLANETDKVMVLIYLEGGNDGLNTVIPMAHYSGLAKVRSNILIPESKLLVPKSADFGFHPALSGFNSLYNEGRLQVIHSTGYPEQSFSHFRSTDIWMSGSKADELVSSGWTGRYLEKTHPMYPEQYPNGAHPDPMAVEIGHGASMLFQGEKAGFSMVINDVNSFYKLVDNANDETPDTVAGDKLRHIRLMAEQSQKYGAVVKAAAERIKQQKPYPEKNRLARQLQVVSRLVAGGLKTPLYLVRIGGFDTHDNQVEGNDTTKGKHATLLAEVNDAIMAFMADLEYQGTADRVMGMTFSEFGRRMVSNASMGTDHGSAAPLFIFGNMSYGGSQGVAPIIKGTENYSNNLPIQHDFRQIYSSLLSQWLGADSAAINAATRGNFKEVPVTKDALITAIQKEEVNSVNLYPNPAHHYATVKFMAFSSQIQVDLISAAGKHIQQLYQGSVKENPITLTFDVHQLPTGRYIVRIIDGNQLITKHLIVK